MNSAFEIIDHQRFRPYLVANAQIELLHRGTRWAEGPVWIADMQALLWSDVPGNRMLRWVEGQPASVFRENANNANGNSRDREGRLLTCEHAGRRVVRLEHDGTTTVLADRFEGKRLNSPNDLVVKSDGTIWFTDPDYGILSDYTGQKATSEIGRNCVFRLDPATGALSIATDTLDKPNGLAFSPDETILYIADSGGTHRLGGPHEIVAFDVRENGTLGGRRIFAEISPGVPDGFRVDEDGNIWTSAADGVHCLAPDGALIGKIRIPEVVANVEFGGPQRSRLFIAASDALYAVYVGTRGAVKR
jgi:gluconolactonase